MGDALHAHPARLDRYAGVQPSALIQSCRGMIQAALEEDVHARDLLTDTATATRYLRGMLANQPNEVTLGLFLDAHNFLIRGLILSEGSVDHAPLYFREVAHRALELGATGMILAHNHPSGSLVPSAADIRITHELTSALQPLGVRLHDHIVVSRTGELSLRAAGLL